MTDFTGIRALVTGSSSGIGLATARLLTSCGATVVGLDLSAPPGDVRAEASSATSPYTVTWPTTPRYAPPWPWPPLTWGDWTYSSTTPGSGHAAPLPTTTTPNGTESWTSTFSERFAL